MIARHKFVYCNRNSSIPKSSCAHSYIFWSLYQVIKLRIILKLKKNLCMTSQNCHTHFKNLETSVTRFLRFV